jgi:hypothetical protein
MFTWQRQYSNGYEVSSRGDKRFSALNARMPDGRTIEEWYQCDAKGYAPGRAAWKLGKGKPPLLNYPDDGLWQMYLSLWRFWSVQNSGLVLELHTTLATQNKTVLTDCFATTDINQARAIAQILNDWL